MDVVASYKVIAYIIKRYDISCTVPLLNNILYSIFKMQLLIAFVVVPLYYLLVAFVTWWFTGSLWISLAIYFTLPFFSYATYVHTHVYLWMYAS